MASVTELGNIPASTVTAYTDSFKTIAGILGGAIVTIASAVNAFISHRNTQVTKTNTEKTQLNTEAAMAIAPVVATNTTEMDKAAREFIENVKQWNEMVTASRAELLAEVNKLKIGVAKVNLSMNDKLSGIPRIQDTLAKIELKQAEHDKTFQMLSDGIKKRTGQ